MKLRLFPISEAGLFWALSEKGDDPSAPCEPFGTMRTKAVCGTRVSRRPGGVIANFFGSPQGCLHTSSRAACPPTFGLFLSPKLLKKVLE